jgi:capsular exopolysaccharide synthesis family protein
MSKISKALEQARRDRALTGGPLRTPPAPQRAASAAALAPVANSRPHVYEAQPRHAENVDSRLVSLVDPISPAAEQYRTLRHTVEQAQRVEKISLLAVSSPSTGDGKTTTAINLAGALAQAPKAQVILIDVDLRCPQVSSRLALVDFTPGVVGFIQDSSLTLPDVVRPCPSFNLSVLPAGSAIASPYELLKSPRLGHLLDEARRRYDYVVLDTPPIISIPDCRIIGRYVDKFLIVVAANKTPALLLDEALGILPPSTILGIVFNGGESVETTYGYGSGYAAARRRDGAHDGARPQSRSGRLIDRLRRRRATALSHEEPRL